MSEFLPAYPPFSAIREVFPDVFHVEGGFRFGPGMSISRNMTVVRQNGELVLINSVRLSPEREAELEKLGTVKHLLRIGEFHGADDRYYLSKYAPTYWTAKGMKPVENAKKSDRELEPGATPIEGSSVFSFGKGRGVEVALLLEREGGILLTCDSYQNWTTFDGCSFVGRQMMRAMGFGPTHIGGPWAKRMGPAVREDFERLLEDDWKHLVPAHGTVLRDDAKAGLRKAIEERFG